MHAVTTAVGYMIICGFAPFTPVRDAARYGFLTAKPLPRANQNLLGAFAPALPTACLHCARAARGAGPRAAIDGQQQPDAGAGSGEPDDERDAAVARRRRR